jgi:hypothetical protein
MTLALGRTISAGVACAAFQVLVAAPVMIQSAPGRFEIAAVDPTVAHGVAAAAEEAWRVLALPLSLPEGFSSPVYLRVNPAEDVKGDPVPFRVAVEVGGIVSVRIRADAATVSMTRRALVQSLLMRLAVAKHGVTPYLTVPLWLEQACVGYWQTRVDAAQFDAMKQAAALESPPSVETLVNWKRGEAEPRSHATAAIWLMAFFQGESGRAREWQTLLLRLLQGDDPLLAVAVSFPGRFNSAEGRELWWRTGYHHLRRIRTLPALEVADSREQLGALARFVFSDPAGERDVLVPLRELLGRAGEPVVGAELTRRSAELAKLISTLHPFFRNAGLSLQEAFAARTASASKRERACAIFDQDWRDALDLESTTRQALDALEQAITVSPRS